MGNDTIGLYDSSLNANRVASLLPFSSCLRKAVNNPYPARSSLKFCPPVTAVFEQQQQLATSPACGLSWTGSLLVFELAPCSDGSLPRRLLPRGIGSSSFPSALALLHFKSGASRDRWGYGAPSAAAVCCWAETEMQTERGFETPRRDETADYPHL